MRAEERAAEARWRAEQKAEREAHRLAKQQVAEERRAAGRPPAAASRPETAYLSRAVRRRGRDGSASFRSEGPGTAMRIGHRQGSRRPTPYQEWLDAPKNLSGRAAAEARGLVRVRNADGTVCAWRERAELEALLEDGWLLA